MEKIDNVQNLRDHIECFKEERKAAVDGVIDRSTLEDYRELIDEFWKVVVSTFNTPRDMKLNEVGRMAAYETISASHELLRMQLKKRKKIGRPLTQPADYRRLEEYMADTNDEADYEAAQRMKGARRQREARERFRNRAAQRPLEVSEQARRHVEVTRGYHRKLPYFNRGANDTNEKYSKYCEPRRSPTIHSVHHDSCGEQARAGRSRESHHGVNDESQLQLSPSKKSRLDDDSKDAKYFRPFQKIGSRSSGNVASSDPSGDEEEVIRRPTKRSRPDGSDDEESQVKRIKPSKGDASEKSCDDQSQVKSLKRVRKDASEDNDDNDDEPTQRKRKFLTPRKTQIFSYTKSGRLDE